MGGRHMASALPAVYSQVMIIDCLHHTCMRCSVFLC